MKWWENPSLSLVPSVWSQQFQVLVVEEAPRACDWVYAVVCDCCGEIKFDGCSDECQEWLIPMFVRPCLN